MEELVFLAFFVFGIILSGLVLWKVFDMVRNSIKKNKGKYEDNKFDRLAKAFIEHRKDTDRRLENIETILSSDAPDSEPEPLDKPDKTIGKKHPRNTSNIEVT